MIYRARLAFLLIVPPLLFSPQAVAQAAESQADFELQPPAQPQSSTTTVDAPVKHRLWATYYNMSALPAVADGVPFMGRHGNPLSDEVSHADWCRAAAAGSTQVRFKGTLRRLTVGGLGRRVAVDCAAVMKGAAKPGRYSVANLGRAYFRLAPGAYGDGGRGYNLVPYRTVAVDRALFPIDTVLFIPGARGVTVRLPSGVTVTHDGYFLAADIGPAVKGNHIDVFCGTAAGNCFPGLIGNRPGRTFDAVVIKDHEITAQLKAAHER